jgi:hypothetical protein
VTGALNHLGVEVSSSADGAEASARLARQGLDTADQEGVSCCYALQDKVWVRDPNGAPSEVYTVLADAPVANDTTVPGCCASAAQDEAKADAVVPCC